MEAYRCDRCFSLYSGEPVLSWPIETFEYSPDPESPENGKLAKIQTYYDFDIILNIAAANAPGERDGQHRDLCLRCRLELLRKAIDEMSKLAAAGLIKGGL